jgi:hypothetical protein
MIAAVCEAYPALSPFEVWEMTPWQCWILMDAKIRMNRAAEERAKRNRDKS